MRFFLNCTKKNIILLYCIQIQIKRRGAYPLSAGSLISRIGIGRSLWYGLQICKLWAIKLVLVGVVALWRSASFLFLLNNSWSWMRFCVIRLQAVLLNSWMRVSLKGAILYQHSLFLVANPLIDKSLQIFQILQVQATEFIFNLFLWIRLLDSRVRLQQLGDLFFLYFILCNKRI